MQVVETNDDGLKHDFKVVIPAADIEQKVEHRLHELAQSVRIPGFRPGKIPLSLLKKRYGQPVMDEIIEQTAPAGPLNQIAATDRNILRLAIYEIVIDNKVPMRAAINEAVELAKEYGGDNSPRFVNGVLGSVSALVTADRG